MKGYAGTYPKYTIADFAKNVYMKYTLEQKLDSSAISLLIEKLRNAELCRDIEETLTIFSPIWSNIEIEPDFSEFDEFRQAELLRLAGFFLSYYGKARNLLHYQERSKNLLTNSIDLFSKFDKPDKIAEAKVILAGCYFLEGAINECELILEETKVEFERNRLHPVYLQICLNRVVATLSKRQYDETFKILNEISVSMEFCNDTRLCILFHEKSAMVYKYTAQYEKAIYHYNKAIKFAKESNNYIFQALNKNNLANLYLAKCEFDLAHSNENEAIKLAHTHNLVGWLAHFLDTKALIYFDEGNFKSALETINEAISIFQKGEDAGGLTEALWNKCKFLLHLNRKKEAIKLFAELAPIASQRMGDFAVDNFADEFAKLIHIKSGGSLKEETTRFRRVEIITAIRKAKYDLNAAAHSLKISLTDLTQIIDEEFPELYEEINIERFTAINNETGEIAYSSQRDISELILQNDKFSFENQLLADFSTYYIASEKMEDVFNISQDVVMAIVPINKLTPDKYILVNKKANGVYSFGKVQYDETLDLYFLLEKDEPMPLSLDKVDLVGKAIAYFPFTEIDNEQIKFKPLKF